MTALNETHDSTLTSWVLSANTEYTDFPIQNLPFACFRRWTPGEVFRVGVAIGDQVLDLAALAKTHCFAGPSAQVLEAGSAATMNDLMALGASCWQPFRRDLSRALASGSKMQAVMEPCLVPMAEVEYTVPARIGDYTDFYSSIHHATNVGKQFRPDNPLLPNYEWVPIGYHGRSSSIGISGQAFHRPVGQLRPAGTDKPFLGPSQRMDYELEVGIFIGPGNPLGQPISMADAEQHVFGLCLFNDWSARDIQAWEYQPLGPFLGKNFASTLSPWIVTLDALAPFRAPWQRAPSHPAPLAYLDSAVNSAAGGFDLNLEALILTDAQRQAGHSPTKLASTNFKHSYWTVSQLVAHHASNGCNLCPGDLFGSGTQSGPAESEVGSLLELSQGGTKPVLLDNGEARGFLEDGDTVIMRGFCENGTARRIGFGEVNGTVLPARV